MQHTDSEYLGQLEDELQAAVLESIPLEKRLQGLSAEEVLATIPVEKRLQGLAAEEVLGRFPAKDRVRGLSPEELAAGLSEEQAARLRELLEQKQGG